MFWSRTRQRSERRGRKAQDEAGALNILTLSQVLSRESFGPGKKLEAADHNVVLLLSETVAEVLYSIFQLPHRSSMSALFDPEDLQKQ